jgi:hypothetical protein
MAVPGELGTLSGPAHRLVPSGRDPHNAHWVPALRLAPVRHPEPLSARRGAGHIIQIEYRLEGKRPSAALPRLDRGRAAYRFGTPHMASLAASGVARSGPRNPQPRHSATRPPAAVVRILSGV